VPPGHVGQMERARGGGAELEGALAGLPPGRPTTSRQARRGTRRRARAEAGSRPPRRRLRGRSGIASALLGSVSRHVVSHAPARSSCEATIDPVGFGELAVAVRDPAGRGVSSRVARCSGRDVGWWFSVGKARPQFTKASAPGSPNVNVRSSTSSTSSQPSRIGHATSIYDRPGDVFPRKLHPSPGGEDRPAETRRRGVFGPLAGFSPGSAARAPTGVVLVHAAVGLAAARGARTELWPRRAAPARPADSVTACSRGRRGT
jgi:hypothetical protein